MPNCFILTRIGETEPTSLNKIDEFICGKLCEIVDPKYSCRYWKETVGIGFALGHTFNELREIFADTDLIEIIDLLEAYFTVEAWSQRH